MCCCWVFVVDDDGGGGLENHYTLKSCFCHLHIMSVSNIYSNSKRNALTILPRRLRLVPDSLLSVGFGPGLSPRGAFVIAPSIDCHFQLIPTFLSYIFRPSIHIRLNTRLVSIAEICHCTVLDAPRLRGSAFH